MDSDSDKKVAPTASSIFCLATVVENERVALLLSASTDKVHSTQNFIWLAAYTASIYGMSDRKIYIRAYGVTVWTEWMYVLGIAVGSDKFRTHSHPTYGIRYGKIEKEKSLFDRTLAFQTHPHVLGTIRICVSFCFLLAEKTWVHKYK